jgi:hypothetical protein
MFRKQTEANASKRGRKFRTDRLTQASFAADQFGLIPTQPHKASPDPSRIRAAAKKLRDLRAPVSRKRDIDPREREETLKRVLVEAAMDNNTGNLLCAWDGLERLRRGTGTYTAQAGEVLTIENAIRIIRDVCRRG